METFRRAPSVQSNLLLSGRTSSSKRTIQLFIVTLLASILIEPANGVLAAQTSLHQETDTYEPVTDVTEKALLDKLESSKEPTEPVEVEPMQDGETLFDLVQRIKARIAETNRKKEQKEKFDQYYGLSQQNQNTVSQDSTQEHDDHADHDYFPRHLEGQPKDSDQSGNPSDHINTNQLNFAQEKTSEDEPEKPESDDQPVMVEQMSFKQPDEFKVQYSHWIATFAIMSIFGCCAISTQMVRISRDCKISINELNKRKQHQRTMQMYWSIKRSHMAMMSTEGPDLALSQHLGTTQDIESNHSLDSGSQ